MGIPGYLVCLVHWKLLLNIIAVLLLWICVIIVLFKREDKATMDLFIFIIDIFFHWKINRTIWLDNFSFFLLLKFRYSYYVCIRLKYFFERLGFRHFWAYSKYRKYINKKFIAKINKYYYELLGIKLFFCQKLKQSKKI